MIGTLRVEVYYDYNDIFRKALLQYKENGDKFLAPLFMHPILLDFVTRYRNHVFVCAPSRLDSMKKRGFEHLQLILEVYGFKTASLLENSALEDQTLSKNRKEIFKHIRLMSLALDKNTKIVLFDDVLTSGSTIVACHNKLSKIFNNITIIVLSSTKK